MKRIVLAAIIGTLALSSVPTLSFAQSSSSDASGETVEAGPGDNMNRVGPEADALKGGPGNNEIRGAEGNDSTLGSPGNDGVKTE